MNSAAMVVAGLQKRESNMPSEIEPGDIVRYVTNIRTPPQLKPGEILCHNHVAHLASTSHGINGFR